MSNRNPQSQRHRCWCQHLIPVSNQQKEIRAHLSKKVGKTERGNANGLGHPYVTIGAEEALDPSTDLESVSLDFLDRVPKLRRQMGAEGDDLEVHMDAVQ